MHKQIKERFYYTVQYTLLVTKPRRPFDRPNARLRLWAPTVLLTDRPFWLTHHLSDPLTTRQISVVSEASPAIWPTGRPNRIRVFDRANFYMFVIQFNYFFLIFFCANKSKRICDSVRVGDICFRNVFPNKLTWISMFRRLNAFFLLSFFELRRYWLNLHFWLNTDKIIIYFTFQIFF